ncbi:SRPBCC domain-containing protein [Sphaerisporangium sp. TRM90804]|uniref:SRPBCC domain-containing protein n=1 Tax=Sphaerisporangium sp. TRM90804 TaxID=3031113 RepID=UPI00244D18D5|nr:SRPBCC domain-containing protein [Sphaerisporangium sp. TRM90804]MDH2423873.1 SRPBCC domain-containing protein [Sphaerisporangium sp. TRM90804]
MAMRFEHEFTVPVPVEQAWAVLLDVERVAPCLPGATLDTVDGDVFTGRMKVKVGPITVTYRGEASFAAVDKDAHSISIKASGKEARGTGTASATVAAALSGQGSHTRVNVETSFNVTGRPAQFGRGVMAEVGAKLIDRFAANLAALLRETPEPPSETALAQGAAPPLSDEPAPTPFNDPAVPPSDEPAAASYDEPATPVSEPAATPFNEPAAPPLSDEPVATPFNEPAGATVVRPITAVDEPSTPPAEPAEPAGQPAAAAEPAVPPVEREAGATAFSEPTAAPAGEAAPTPFGAPAAGPSDGDEDAAGPEQPVRHLTAVPNQFDPTYAEEAVGREAHPAGTARTSRTADEEALDLLEIAGVPLLKRAAPIAGGLTLLILAIWLIRRILTQK